MVWTAWRRGPVLRPVCRRTLSNYDKENYALYPVLRLRSSTQILVKTLEGQAITLEAEVVRPLNDPNQLESTLYLVLRLCDGTQILVRTLTGEMITLNAEVNDSLDDVEVQTRGLPLQALPCPILATWPLRD